MTHSKHTDKIVSTALRSPRTGRGILYFQLHHTASTDGPGVVAMMVNGSREVSANYVIFTDGTAVNVVDEDLRAWTSAAPIQDSEAITFEISDDHIPGYTVSPQAHEKTALIIADAASRYGIPIIRDRIYGHREMLGKFGTSYATACPGGLDIDWIVARAQAIQKTGSTTPTNPTKDEDEMATPKLYRNNKTGKIIAADLGTGFQYDMPNQDYLGLWIARGWCSREPMADLPPNEFDYVLSILALARKQSQGEFVKTAQPVLSDATLKAFAKEVNDEHARRMVK